ncbi:TM2 domain-containing protein [Rhodococcus sp. NPDC003382]|uniref:TM2 domain-containing protein n=2 Tax=unclassified Rhodococcus (in: high G+C Gram-positive bacteria) TaxID=192944 RepID=UPI0018CE085E|nr:TM2 domain-containing protein [Rhodococcus sp. CX]
MTTPDPAASDPNSGRPIDFGKKASDPADAQSNPNFGPGFDYDATAQASLSEPPQTSESTAASPGTAGPGWDTYSGIGNGPGWGTTPSYPPPSDYSSAPQQPGGPAGPVYGTPNPQYPMGDQSGYGAPGGFGGPTPPPPPQPYGAAPGYGAAAPGYGPGGTPGYGFADPSAPYGRDPLTGEPYSDKSRMTAGLLEILLGAFGAGRFYLNQPGLAIAQIAVVWLTCGLGGIWPLIDGIMMLTGKVRDEHNRPLQP